jgi:hypothetical protein
LTKALTKVSWFKLAKELAFCLTTTVDYRLATEDRYRLAMNSIVAFDIKSLAVVQLSKQIKRFDDFVCVDIRDYDDEFIQNNPSFIKLLLEELKCIRRL